VIKSCITDGTGTDVKARVTPYGQLVVAPISYSTSIANSLTVNDAGVTFINPSMGQRVVITDIILTSDKNVGTNGAAVEVYESSGFDDATVTSSILSIEMLKNTSRDLIGLNFLSSGGVWINAKTDDNNIQVTLGYYYVPID